jgi:hypothetical protein
MFPHIESVSFVVVNKTSHTPAPNGVPGEQTEKKLKNLCELCG